MFEGQNNFEYPDSCPNYDVICYGVSTNEIIFIHMYSKLIAIHLIPIEK